MVSNEHETPHLDKYCSTLCTENQVLLNNFIRSKQLAGAKASTIMAHQLAIHSIINYLGDKPLDTITREQLEDWYLWYRDTPSKRTGKKPNMTTVLNVVTGIRQVLETIHGEEQTASMFKRIKPGRVNKVVVKEDQLLSDDEVCRMLSACDGERDRAVVAVLASSGCRVGELCNLKIRDVRLYREKATLHLDGKTGPRDIDIYDGVPELKRWIQVHPYRDDQDAPLFVNHNHRGSTIPQLRPRGVGKLLNRLAEKAGIPPEKRWNPHSFRHKRATDLADHLTQADLRVMFGWTDMSNTPNIYVHSSRQKVSRKLAELAGVKIPIEQQMRKLTKYCPVCGSANSINDKWCNYCFSVLDDELANVEDKLKKFMLDDMKKGKK